MIDVADWIGRSETASDIAVPRIAAGLAALLDRAPDTDVLPPLAHWCCFPPDAPQHRIGADGHPVRDDASILPPVDLPRRMWAGSRVTFHAPIPVGAELERISTLVAATPKTGRSGAMLFATVRHRVTTDGVVAIEEEQDIVYRAAGSATVAPIGEPLPPAPIEEGFVADSVRLFRYSALTFNAHRIHYDRDYARDVEGYPGLVVHGPYLATLLIDLHRRRAGAAPKIFAFRAQAPLFDGVDATLAMTPGDDGAAELAVRADGRVCMAATVTI